VHVIFINFQRRASDRIAQISSVIEGNSNDFMLAEHGKTNGQV